MPRGTMRAVQRRAAERRRLVSRLIGCLILSGLAPARADNPGGGLSLDAAQLGARRPHVAPAATLIAPRAPRMPAVMAGGRPEMQATYAQMLAAFEQGLDKNGMPRNDLAVAAAIYISGAYGAYHGTQVSDAAFVALVTQLRDALVATPAFTSASLADKQDLYEAWAITGTLMAVTAQTRPGDQAARAAARSYLETFLRAGADSIQLNERGLSLAGAGTPAPASTPPSPAQAPPPPAIEAAPPRPVEAAPPPHAFSPTKVTALLWKTEMRYEAFPANSMVMHEEDYLLLADGTCTGRVPASFDAFDPAADRAAHPKSWCRWRKRGAGYEVAYGGKWEAISGATVLRAAKRGERLAGVWSRSRTGTVGTGSTWHGTTLSLTADGRFKLTSAGHFTTNSSLDPPRGEAVVSGTYRNDDADTAGSYALDGFGIELRYDSGKVERKMFGISSDGGHTFVRLGGEMMPKSK